MERTIYEAVGGYDALLTLTETWHELCKHDPLTEHPFAMPNLHPQHTERLAAYLAEALGGPSLYSDSMGDETYVQALHGGEGAHTELDVRAIELFDVALVESGTPQEVREPLSQYFRWAAAQMEAYADSVDLVPDGLRIPHWSWNGPVG